MTAGVSRQHGVDGSFDVPVLVAFVGLLLGDLTASKSAVCVIDGLLQLALQAVVVQAYLRPVARVCVAPLGAEAEQREASEKNRLIPNTMGHRKGPSCLLESPLVLWRHCTGVVHTGMQAVLEGAICVLASFFCSDQACGGCFFWQAYDRYDSNDSIFLGSVR